MAENFTYKIEDVSKRPSPFSRALRKVRLFALRNARGFIELALAFIFSVSGNDEYDVSPLSCAAVGACAIYGSSPLFAFAGAAAGALIMGRFAALSALALYVGVSMLITLIKGELRPSDKLLLLVGVQVALLPFFFFKSVLSCAAGLGSTLLSAALAAVLARGEHAFITLQAGRKLNKVNLVSLTVSLAALILALAGIRFFVSPAVILALTLSLAAASARRLSGVGAAALFALACAIKGGDAAYTALITASAAAAAALAGGGRWAVEGGTAVVWGALSYIFALPSQALLEASAAIMLFALIPRRYILRLKREHEDTKASRAQAALDKTRARLTTASEVVDEMCSLFTAAHDEIRCGETRCGETRCGETRCGGAVFAQQTLLGVSALMKSMAQDAPALKHPAFSYRVGACAKAKHGSIETGDSVGIRESDAGLLLLLSDGMGTGAAAHRESAQAVAMLGDLFSVGFELTAAEACVNRLLVLKSEHDMYATLDAAFIDLNSGTAEFIKHGAPPSYILRDGKLYTIYSEALPMGILSSAPPSVHTLRLERGDSVIMTTDGVTDALGDSLIASITELVSASNTADDAAAALLSAAAGKSEDDDMTVIVLRLI